MGPLHDAETASRAGTPATQAGPILLLAALVALLISFAMPWWSLKVMEPNRSHVVVTYALHGWGWLSFTAWLLALIVASRLFLPRKNVQAPTTRGPEGQALGWAILASGGVELLGNALFIHAAPKTRIDMGAGMLASHGAGLDVAIGCGIALLLSGLLLLIQYRRGTSSEVLRVRFAHPAQPVWHRRQLPCPE
jgi:hypothetical protein